MDEPGFRIPLQNQLYSGLQKVDLPFDFSSESFAKFELSAPEIDTLVFGHQLHGRSLDYGDEHGLIVSADCAAQLLGTWGGSSGQAKIENGMLCIEMTSSTSCVRIFRNPGGTRARE